MCRFALIINQKCKKMNVPHLIKAGSTNVLLGQINPVPPKVDCRVWAEDIYQEILEILVAV